MTSTQQFIPIEDIYDNLIFLKDGSAAMVVSTSAVNFGLLFETEQVAIIESFAGLLNSLSFPIQIVIISKRLDISSYLDTLDRARQNLKNPLLSQMALSYKKFIEGLIKEKNVLDKQFYITLSVTPAEFGLLPQNNKDQEKKALTILSPRRDHLIGQLQRIGLKAKQLNSEELIKLFYALYNPISGNVEPIPQAKIQNIQQIVSQTPPVPTVAIRKLNLSAPKIPTPPLPTTIPSPPVPLVPPLAPLSSPVPPSPLPRVPFVTEELSDEQPT